MVIALRAVALRASEQYVAAFSRTRRAEFKREADERGFNRARSQRAARAIRNPHVHELFLREAYESNDHQGQDV